ncbi:MULTISPECIES: hypothetical protein [Mammaliicoccus]|uniref:DUF4352 domain-containing protein n=1 Tax=Mammaliicoccus lentus TaxID=42858 RepID=A0AAX3W609_MAMLE|nr:MULTISPECIES: hypothetical protein [Mammaliicoccus]WHI54232.1 hypothetical protein PYH59_10340 [Mammaliicoccus lentus]WHI56755.1 hypothetical protein PYH49_10005 [Mammaliicoccus lentus]WHI60822.1 hypothetical protein PYH69_04100 [Mammaliicoccus lentus]WHI64604.1 hypothetical protein PYH50_10010 [Mammaliicoccus lentus]WHI85496.1 hypothetical protein PYH60_10015 [Mammaliicoccus lentus]
MNSLIFTFVWILISIAFVTMLVTTIVKIANKSKFVGVLISTVTLFFVGLICFVSIFLTLPKSSSYSVDQLFGEQQTKDKKTETKKLEDTPEKGLKGLELGDKIRVNGLEITVVKAEFVQPEDQYYYPENGKVLKVYYKFKNVDKKQILVDNSAFDLTIDGESQNQFFGMNENTPGFQHQLKKGNTENSYLYYDVPEADNYKVEMNFKPEDKTYKADWNIKNSEVKETESNQPPATEEVPTEQIPSSEEQYNNNAVQNNNQQKKLEEQEKKRQEEADKKAQEEEKQAEADKKREEELKQKEEEKAKEEEKKAQEEADKKAEEQQRKEEEQAQEDAEKKAEEQQRQAEEKAKEEADRKAQEEADKKAQEDAEQKAKDNSSNEDKADSKSNEDE